MKNKILKEITNNTCKLIKYKTIKNEYKEFDKAYDFIKQELNNYNIKEYIINNYKNLVISNTEENNLDIIFDQVFNFFVSGFVLIFLLSIFL